ncbi:MAG: hypothetical protein ACMZ64_05495 [Oleiphilus sp.]
MSDLINMLTVSEKIALAALLVISPPDGRSFTRKMIGPHTYTPSHVLSDQLLLQLIEKRVVQIYAKGADTVSSQSSVLSPGVNLRLTIKNDKECFDRLIDGLNLKQYPSSRNGDIEGLLAQVLVDECMMFLSELTSLDISEYRSIDSVYRYLVEILSYRSMSETYMLLWRAVNDADPIEERFYYLKGNGATNLERLIQKAFQFHLEYKESGKRIKPFIRKAKTPTSSITLLLMEELFGLGSSYYRYPFPLLASQAETEIAYLSEDEKLYLNYNVPQWQIS